MYKNKKLVENKKIIEKEKVIEKEFNNKSTIMLQLDLNKFMEGLQINIVAPKGEDKSSTGYIMVSLGNNPVRVYNISWSDRVIPVDGTLYMHAELLGEKLGTASIKK